MRTESESARKARLTIDALRTILDPTPVKQNHFPAWFARRLKRFPDNSVHRNSTPLDRLYANGGAEWLDHFGSTKIGDVVYFVSEPYNFGPRAARALDELARIAGIEWHVSANSWWCPGSTVRILICEST